MIQFARPWLTAARRRVGQERNDKSSGMPHSTRLTAEAEALVRVQTGAGVAPGLEAVAVAAGAATTNESGRQLTRQPRFGPEPGPGLELGLTPFCCQAWICIVFTVGLVVVSFSSSMY